VLPSQRLREGSDLAHGLGIAEDRVEFLLEFGHVSRPLPPKCLLLLLLDELMKDPKAAGLLKNKALLQSLMQ